MMASGSRSTIIFPAPSYEFSVTYASDCWTMTRRRTAVLTTSRPHYQLLVLAYNLGGSVQAGNFLRRLGLPKALSRHWSLQGVQIKLIKIGHGWHATPSRFARGQDDDEAYSQGC